MQSAGQIAFVMTDISTRLKAEREALGLTQPALAKKAGVSQGSVSHWENGTRKNPRALFKLAHAMNLSPDWLMNGVGTKHANHSAAISISDNIAAFTPHPGWPFGSITPKDWGRLPRDKQIDVEDYVKMLLGKYGEPLAKTAV